MKTKKTVQYMLNTILITVMSQVPNTNTREKSDNVQPCSNKAKSLKSFNSCHQQDYMKTKEV